MQQIKGGCSPMFGRKKSNNPFFYPPGGIEQAQYYSPIQQNYYFARQQPTSVIPFPPPIGNQNWSQTQQPYHMNSGYHQNVYPNQINYNNSYAGYPQLMNQGYSQNVFQNPLLTTDEQYHPYYSLQFPNQLSYNQYPNQAFMQKQPGGMSSLLNSFKGKDGSMDLNKMVNTAGQMVSAISQVSSMVKGLGGMIKI
jgi:hypothetical protein